MAWQDIVIGFGLLLLTYSVIPTIRKQHRLKQGFVPYDTCLLISGVESALVVPFSTTQYWVSVVSCLLLAVLWGIVAVQGYKYRGKGANDMEVGHRMAVYLAAENKMVIKAAK